MSAIRNATVRYQRMAFAYICIQLIPLQTLGPSKGAL